MAYFDTKEQKFIPRPIPEQPSYTPPIVPTPTPTEGGTTPIIHPPTFSGDTTIHLYITNDSRNKVSKTLNNELTFNISFKNDTSVINPVFVLDSLVDLSYYNYMYIEQTQRYYFIDNVEVCKGRLFKIYAVSDVLMSFKEHILNITGIVDFTEKNSLINKDLPDIHYVNSSGKNIKILETHAPSGEIAFTNSPRRILVVSGKTED